VCSHSPFLSRPYSRERRSSSDVVILLPGEEELGWHRGEEELGRMRSLGGAGSAGRSTTDSDGR
jgi:hypothetical protein